MDLEEIVQRILSSRGDLTREKVIGMIEEKKRTAGGFLTDEAAARIVASELGVEVLREPIRPEVWIRDLVSGLNDATVVGRAIAVYPPQTFNRPDGTEGRVARLLIGDKTGTLKVVLWDDKVSLVEGRKVETGQIIKVSHGYVREGLDGRLELHVGLRGDAQVSPPGAVESEYPPIAYFIQKIGKITGKHKKASVLGVVQNVYPASEFKRRDGTRGKVMRLDLRDDTGQITAVLWNEKVDELGDVKKGDHLQIMNSKVKERLDGRLELHVEKATYIKSPEEAGLPPYREENTKIAEIKEEGGPINVEGTITTTPTIREVTTTRKEKITVASFDLTDDTGKIRASIWRKLVDAVRDLPIGTRVKIKNAYVKRGFSDQLELDSRASTSIEALSKPEKSSG